MSAREAELVTRNKSLEAELIVLRAKVKEDEEKLANEEKNVAFLLSRVEILDRQRMEAVNKIIDEKSHAEKELRVRLSSCKAELLAEGANENDWKLVRHQNTTDDESCTATRGPRDVAADTAGPCVRGDHRERQ